MIRSLILPCVRASRLGLLTGVDGTDIHRRDPLAAVVPDVACVRWDRLPEHTAPERDIPVPPDLAIEVISPPDEPDDIARKRDLYPVADIFAEP